MERIQGNLKEVHRLDEEQRKYIEEKNIEKMLKAQSKTLTLSQSAPLGFGEDKWLIRVEAKKMKEVNFEENMKREQKKMEFKKQLILEKDVMYQ